MSTSNNSMVIKEEGDYRIQGFENINNALFDMIRKTFKFEPAFGEIMFFKNSIYFTSQGCSRIAQVNNNKDIRFEYLNPETFPIPLVHNKPESFIIVKCLLTKADGGVVEGYCILNLDEERKYKFSKCKCGQDPKYFRRTPDIKIKECSNSKCGEKITGTEYWGLKNYCNFAETKSFMRAVKKAYNVHLIDELDEEIQPEAQDICQGQVINVQAVDTKIEKNEEKKPEEKPLEKLNLTKKESKKEPTDPQEPTQEEEELIAKMEDFEKQVDTYDKDRKENQISFEDWLKSLEKKKFGQDLYYKTNATTVSDSGKAHQLKFAEFMNPIWFPNQYLVIDQDGIWIREWILMAKKKDFV